MRCKAEFELGLNFPSLSAAAITPAVRCSVSAHVRYVHGCRSVVGQQVKPDRRGCKVKPGPFRRHSHSGEVTGSEGLFISVPLLHGTCWNILCHVSLFLRHSSSVQISSGKDRRSENCFLCVVKSHLQLHELEW